MNAVASPSRGVAPLCVAAGIFLLGLHLYFYCFTFFASIGWATGIVDDFLLRMMDAGVFHHVNTTKGLAVLFLLLGIAASPGRPRPTEVTLQQRWMLAGLLALFVYAFLACSAGVPIPGEKPEVGIAYLIVNGLFLLPVLLLARKLLRYVPLPWRTDDPFGRKEGGFPQEDRRLETKFALNLAARYRYKGAGRNSWINLVNPRRGILILGTPGAGKSWFIVEPLMWQLSQKGIAMLVYDLKYDALTKYAWRCFTYNRDRYPLGTRFYSINFTDLSRSHCCNVLDPQTLTWVSDAVGASRTILLSLNRSWVNMQGNFFVESAINFVAALIWWLKGYRKGIYCTLPHVIELAQLPYDKLFTLLGSCRDVAGLVNPFIEAYAHATTEMLDGQLAGAKVPLGRLASPDLYYVLGGNDVDMQINDPLAPKIVCLGGNASRVESLTPVFSLYIDRMTRICNRPERYPCALVCDEFASVRAYGILTTVATARSNNIIPILALQDIAQLQTLYTREEAHGLVNVCGNVFCGQASGETARWVSERFPQLLRERASISVSRRDVTISRQLHWEPVVTPATVAELSSGEFVGTVADEPGLEMQFKGFHAKLEAPREVPTVEGELPVVRVMTPEALEARFREIKLETERMVEEEMRRIMGESLEG